MDFSKLLGPQGAGGLLDQLKGLGVKAEEATRVYSGLVGPAKAALAPSAPTVPTPSPSSTLPPVPGVLGFSWPVVGLGAAAFGLLVYLARRGR